MPLLDEEELPLPAPAPPPVTPGGGTIGPGGPPIGLPGGTTPEAPAGPTAQGGGGGGYVPPTLPGLPGLNIPGAPQFKYDPFKAPTMEQVMAGPGYQTRLNSANQALERSAAAKGMLRSGNTLSDISELTNNFAGQAYDQEFNRALQSYDRAYRGAYDAFAPGLEAWRIRANNQAGLTRDRYNAELGLFVNNNSRGGGGGGGGEFDPTPYIGDLLPPMPGPAAPQAPIPLPGGGGGPMTPMKAGDPWTDQFNYY